MATHLLSLLRRAPVRLMIVLLTALLAGACLSTLPSHSSPAFAASQGGPIGRLCVQAPSMQHCHDQDPEVQGCASDAHTLDQAEIKENGITIGRVERRWSALCQSWWGRVFDTRPGAHQNMSLMVDGTTLSAPPTFVGDAYRILYSSMVFDATPMQKVPAITGMLEIDGITAAPSATIPEIIPPGNS